MDYLRDYVVRAVGDSSGSIRWAASVTASSAREAFRRAVRICPYPPAGFLWTVFRQLSGGQQAVLEAQGDRVIWCGEDRFYDYL